MTCTPSGEVWAKRRWSDADADGDTSMGPGAVVVGLDASGADHAGSGAGAAPSDDGVRPNEPPPCAACSPGAEAETVPDSGRTSTPSRRSRRCPPPEPSTGAARALARRTPARAHHRTEADCHHHHQCQGRGLPSASGVTATCPCRDLCHPRDIGRGRHRGGPAGQRVAEPVLEARTGPVVHGASSGSAMALRRRAHPRWTSEATVPGRQCRRAAISASLICS